MPMYNCVYRSTLEKIRGPWGKLRKLDSHIVGYQGLTVANSGSYYILWFLKYRELFISKLSALYANSKSLTNF